MAQYKVIQDIEAEDKLLGPLSLKGLIYAGIAAFLIFINFRLALASSLGSFRWIIILILLPPMVLFAVLASPLGRDQPTEVWLLSHVRFFLKPKRRIWDQSGISHLVTITAPKKIERQLTKGFSQTEVNSRLKALAMTLDSRGWAVKNVNLNLGGVPGYLEDTENDSDRLVGASSLPQPTPVSDVQAADDILDEDNNPIARYFKGLVQQKDAQRKSNILHKLHLGHKNKPGKAKAGLASHKAIRKSRVPDVITDKEIGDPALHDQHPYFKPALSLAEERRQAAERAKRQAQEEKSKKTQEVTAANQAVNMELAQSGNDLSVASIQGLANRKNQIQQIGPNEGVISLH